MVNFTVDGKNISAPEGTMLLEAIRDAGISIPTLCAHESVSRSGACRLCVVEIKKGNRSRIVTSCLYAAEEGLMVNTQSDRVLNVRRLVMELLLARCPESDVLKKWPQTWALNRNHALCPTQTRAPVCYAVPVFVFVRKLSVSAPSVCLIGASRKKSEHLIMRNRMSASGAARAPMSAPPVTS